MSPMSRSDARKRAIQDHINAMHARFDIAMTGAWPHPPTEPTQERTMTSPAQRRHEELVALLTEIRDRLPEPEGVAPEPETCRTCGQTLIVTGTIDCLTCFLAPVVDLPGEPVEPGDLRAGDRVAFTWEGTGERITCTLVSEGDVLRSDAPDSNGYRPNVVGRDREWAGGISDVRLIERAPREDDDPDELVRLGEQVQAVRDGSGYTIQVGGVLIAKCDTYGRTTAERSAIARAEKAEAERDASRHAGEALAADRERLGRERDDAIARAESWRDANSGIHAERDAALDEVVRLRVSVEAAKDERDEWKARYKALRADVEREYAAHPGYPTARILDADDKRGRDA